MKANELRIGSLIDYNDIHCTVEVINGEVDEVYILGDSFYYGVNIKEIEPIPLTEERLLKFGFFTTQWDNFNSHRLMIGNNDFTIIIYSDGNCEVGDGICLKCEHVHQLQNLYFALTNEELTIK